MKLTILGPGCTNCRTLENRVRSVVEARGLDAEIAHVSDYAEIASWGIVSTPGLAVDGEVVVSGRVPTEREIASLIASR